MATIAIMVGGAILNAATFIGGNYLAKALSGDSGQAALDEKKRHDLALEKYQRDYAQYQKDRTQLLDWVAEQDREKNQAFQRLGCRVSALMDEVVPPLLPRPMVGVCGGCPVFSWVWFTGGTRWAPCGCRPPTPSACRSTRSG